MMDSKMKRSFQITSTLCSAGSIGFCGVWFDVLISTRIRRWYRYTTLSLMSLFVFNQMFCRNGGGLIIRLVSHVSDSFQLWVDDCDTGMASVFLFMLFLLVLNFVWWYVFCVL